jgi:4-hydroxybenzoate polyprenyltransferase
MHSEISKKLSGFALIKEWAEMIKLEHTVFALPFALSGLILGLPTGLPSLPVVFFTVLAFAGARSAAMTLNRLIDASIDAKNPRTRERSIPAGKISSQAAVLFTLVSFGVMLFAVTKLPPICLYLSPIAVFFLSLYSFTKRFTWLCHIVLGICLGGAALGGWVAAAGSISGIAPYVLALAVLSWVAGFDIIYACQDEDFDKAWRLHSIPQQFGVAKALGISAVLHVVTGIMLGLLGYLMCLGWLYFAGVALVVAMLVYEHSLVSAKDLSKVNAAFFTVNGIVSILAFLTILLDRIFQK